MDGIISAPICLAGFFLLPDLPENTRAFYLTENVRVMSADGRSELTIARIEPWQRNAWKASVVHLERSLRWQLSVGSSVSDRLILSLLS